MEGSVGSMVGTFRLLTMCFVPCLYFWNNRLTYRPFLLTDVYFDACGCVEIRIHFFALSLFYLHTLGLLKNFDYLWFWNPK